MTAVPRDPLHRRISAALRARDFPGYFALHDQILSRTEAPTIAKLTVEPGDVLIVKCRSEHESLSGLVARLPGHVRAVLLPAACEIAVVAKDGDAAGGEP